MPRPKSPVRILSLLIVLIALGARIIPGTRTIDDSYITFRYARNILAGNGFVYNPGERVLGTTTPLYTLLLSSLGAISGGTNAPFDQLALGINALADAATCLLLMRLGRKGGMPSAGAGAALAWAIAPFSVTFAIGGLETSLYVLLLVAASTAALEKKYASSAFFGALAFLTRPDALILLGPLGLNRAIAWLNTRRSGVEAEDAPPSLREVLIFTLPVIAWLVFAGIYFGSPLPHSIAAKSVAYRLPADAGFVRLLQHYAVPFMGNQVFGIPWMIVGLFAYPALFVIGALHMVRRDPRSWAIAAYPWLYFATFALANPLIFRWYLTPPLPFYYLFILVGLNALINEIVRAAQGKILKYKTGLIVSGAVSSVLLILFPTGLLLSNWTRNPDHGLPYPAPQMAWYQLELYYSQAAQLLEPELGANPSAFTLAAGDVGVLGFTTQARILDTVGLNSPVSSAYYPTDPDYYVINYAIPPELILDQQPDYVIILEVYGRAGLLPDPRFQQAYRLLHKIPTDIYGSDGMLIFARTQIE